MEEPKIPLLSGFADEAAENVDRQMDIFAANGLRYIEMRNVNGKNILDHTDEELSDIRKRLDARGFRVSAIGSPVGKSGIEDDFQEEEERFRKAVNAALIMGAKYIRAFSFYIPKNIDPTGFGDAVVSRLRGFAETAGKNGLVYALENDTGLFGDTWERCLHILENVSSDSLQIVFDPGNFIFSGSKPYPTAYEGLKKHIAYFHVKDAKKGEHFVPSGEGEAEMESLLKAAYQDGFDGFLSIEPHLGYLEGLNNAQRFTKACNALKESLNNALGTKLEPLDLRIWSE